MMHRILIIILSVLLSCAACFGQAEFHGLTAGKSTRADVERVFGQPLKELSQTLVEYQPNKEMQARVNKIYVQYRKGSPIVERIEALLVQPLNRSDVLTALHLPQQPTRSRLNSRGVLEEYFGPPFYLVLTYQGAEAKSGVARTGRYSRELFENALAPPPSKPANTAPDKSISVRRAAAPYSSP